MSQQRSRRSRRVNANECDEESVFEYQEGDLKTVETSDGLDIEFRIRVLSDLLICPLCQGFFREAMTAKECLHTFCKSCILLKFANGLASCPVCSMEIPSHLDDAIQRDDTIQNLVDKLFPHFALQDEEERQDLLKICGFSSNTFTTSSSTLPAPYLSTEHDGEHQAPVGAFSCLSLPHKPKPSSVKIAEATEEWLQWISNPQSNLAIPSFHAFKLHLIPFEGTQPLARPYIRTSGTIQVHQLALYISDKLGLENHQLLELSLNGQALGNSHTIEFICRSRRYDTGRCIPIHFRLIGISENETQQNMMVLV